MAVRITDFIHSGDLRNTSRNRIFGWIEFAPDYGIFLELAGNFSGPLAGKHIRFRRSPNTPPAPYQPGQFPEFIERLANRQIGVIQSAELRSTQVPTIPEEDFVALRPDQQARHLVEKECLFLEWSSQNGRVVSELIEPDWEYVNDDEESAANGSNNALHRFDDDGQPDMTIEMYGIEDVLEDDDDDDLDGDGDDDDDDDDDDPYGLFDPEVQDAVEQSLGTAATDFEDAGQADLQRDGLIGAKPPSWDEIIPGIDSETKQMYEQWDEIFAGKKDEPISYLLPKVLKLPMPDQVQSEEEAEGLVKKILAQLALLSVAIDICEHFTMLDTYRLLVEHLLPEARVHPNLAASEMVQHYSTFEYCKECDAELFEEDEEDDDAIDPDEPE